MKKECIYAIYRGDDFVTCGTAKECCHDLGFKDVIRIHNLYSKFKKGIIDDRKKQLYAIKLR